MSNELSYWFCPKCREELDGCHVTYHELCEYCGTHALSIDETIPAKKIAEILEAHQENRVIVLPVPIGAPVWVTYPQITDTDGSVIPAGVEELHLSGYINEDGREFYLTTYSECDTGCCDVLPDNLFVTREAAEAALKEHENHD